MRTILDNGPRPPVAPDDKDDAVAVAAYKVALKEHADWHKANSEPVKVRMHSVDANAAIAADPERYSEVSRDVISRKSGSLEERVAALEERTTDLETEVWPPEEKPVAEPQLEDSKSQEQDFV